MKQKDFRVIAKIIASLADSHIIALAENKAILELGIKYPSFDAEKFRSAVKHFENVNCPNPGCCCGSCYNDC